MLVSFFSFPVVLNATLFCGKINYDLILILIYHFGESHLLYFGAYGVEWVRNIYVCICITAEDVVRVKRKSAEKEFLCVSD